MTKQQQAEVASHGSQAPPTETLHTTTEHPFLTTDRGFVDAQDLQMGERVIRLDGSTGMVLAMQVTPGAAVRYNLTVQDLHTYAVGADQWVVHNCGPKEVLLDTNAVYNFRSKASALLGDGEEAVISEGVLGELEANAANGARAFPEWARTAFRVVPDDIRIGTLQRLSPLLARVAGRDGDAALASTAINTGRAVITGDENLANALRVLGQDVRYFRPN